MNENQDVITITDKDSQISETPMTVKAISDQKAIIHGALKGAMTKDVHYGVIPGLPKGSKPTLLKAGAEMILMLFHLTADPIIEDLSTPDMIRYRVRCRIANRQGIFLGAGVGEASTDEEKYRWRKPKTDQEYDDAPITHKKLKYYVDYETKKNCTSKLIRTNPFDQANTVLKIAKKRALTDGVLTVTGASDLFAQDVEDGLDNPKTGQDKKGYKGSSDKAATGSSDKAETNSGGKINKAQNSKVFAMYTALIEKGVWKEGTHLKEISFILDLKANLTDTRDLTISQVQTVFDAMQKKLDAKPEGAKGDGKLI